VRLIKGKKFPSIWLLVVVVNDSNFYYRAKKQESLQMLAEN